MLILDTDHISLLEWAESARARRIRDRFERLPDEPMNATIVSFEEQTRGWLSILASARTMVKQIEAYSQLKRLLSNYCKISVLDFDEKAATEFQRLVKLRLRLGTMDLKIASIALAHDAT